MLIVCLLLFVASGVQAQELGRLFTTPQERAILERLRHAPPAAEEKPPSEKQVAALPKPAKPVAVPRITINGIVSRSDGSSTVWVNGMNSLEGDLESQQIRVDTHGIRGTTVPVQLLNRPGRVRLRPGETYEPSMARVIEGYQRPWVQPEVPEQTD